MLGNLKIFFGPDEFNDYAHWLRTLGEPFLHYEWALWIVRVVLVAAVVAHARLRVPAQPPRHQGPPGPKYVHKQAPGELRHPHHALGRHHPRACSSSGTSST